MVFEVTKFSRKLQQINFKLTPLRLATQKIYPKISNVPM